jgi:hypothetical protein
VEVQSVKGRARNESEQNNERGADIAASPESSHGLISW